MKSQKKCGSYSVLNLATKGCRKCPKGYIKRSSYYRTAKNNKRGSIKQNKNSNSKKYVHEACIKSRGLPGKTGLRYGGEGQPKGIGPLKKGELGKYGYHHLDKLSKTERELSLKMAVKDMGAPRVVRKLGAIRTYLKNTSPRVSNKFYEDQKWVRKTFDSDFKGDYKNSKLFNN